MVKVIYPIHLDIDINPISSKFREIVRHSGATDIDYFSFSKGHNFASSIWLEERIHKVSPFNFLFKKYNIVHQGNCTPKNNLMVELLKKRSRHLIHILTLGIEYNEDDAHFAQVMVAISKADLLIANSEAVAASYKKNMGVTIDNIIYNGVDIDFFDPLKGNSSTLERFKVEPNYFLFNSSLIARKRPDLLIEIAKEMKDQSFVMVGKDLINNRAILNNLPENVKYLGVISRSEIRDLLSYSQGLIFTSEKEGLPNAVLEALSIGIPIFVRNKSSMPELITNEVNGWVLETDNVKDWVKKLSIVKDWDFSEIREYGATIRSNTKTKHGWRRYSKSNEEIYQSV